MKEAHTMVQLKIIVDLQKNLQIKWDSTSHAPSHQTKHGLFPFQILPRIPIKELNHTAPL